MLNEIRDLPPGVIGFEVSGKLHTSDYRDILQPALQQAAATGEVRIVIVIPEFKGFSAGACHRLGCQLTDA
jgi:enoyl-CoA hydratase/carnithine racemase